MLTVSPFDRFGILVDREQDQIIDSIADSFKGRVEHHAKVREAIASVIEMGRRHGKHMRSDLVLLGALIQTTDPDLALIARAGAAIELEHTAILIQDDIIDRDSLRRGSATLHSLIGEPLALLGADWLFAHALEVIVSLPVAPRVIQTLFNSLSSTGVDTTLGELLDIETGVKSCSWNRALETAKLKTAAYTGTSPLRMGAILMGDPGEGIALADVGILIGQAFQLQDDLIGLFESSETLGKSVASDIQQGRCSALVAAFLESANETDRNTYHELQADLASSTRPMSAGEVDSVRQLFLQSGARAMLEEAIDHILIEARRAWEQIAVPRVADEAFEELMTRLTARRS